MGSGVDRANRTLLTLIGLLLLLAGAGGLALSFKAFGTKRAVDPVLPASFSTFIGDNPWFWWAVGALCVVVIVLALRWLIAQLHTSGLPDLDVEPDRRRGETVLRSEAISGGVEQEVEGYLGVESATLRLLGSPAKHKHQLNVHLEERADVDAVRRRLIDQTVPNVRKALDFEQPSIDIQLVLAGQSRRRVS